MNETTASFDALTQAQNSLYRQTSQSAQALKDYLSSASQMNLAYAQALGRVRSELSALSNQFRSVAAVGLNAFAGLLHALRPVARGINELVSSLFGVTLKVSEKTGKAADRVTASARSAAAAPKSSAPRPTLSAADRQAILDDPKLNDILKSVPGAKIVDISQK